MSWFSNLVARVTQPAKEPGGFSSIWLPAKKGGVIVTQENALQLSVVFACVRVISSDLAKLPWNVYAEQGAKRVRLSRSTIGYLLNTRPNPETGAFAFRETMVAWALTYGNGYAEVERDLRGQPIALWQISPDRVQVKRTEANRIVYEVSNGTGREPSMIQPENMFHLHGLGFDGLTGYSTVALAAQSIGFGLAAEQHGAAFYGTNAVLGRVLEHPMRLSDQAYSRLKDSLDKRKGAGAFDPFVAEEGMKVSIPMTKQVDSQYVETRQQQVEEICRWMRVPPQKVMNLKDAHYNNVEHMNISYATDTLGEWAKRLEEEADYKLISNRSQASYTKLNLRAIMRGDSQAQAAWYESMLRNGVYSINEVRELEDIDPIPDGDKHMVQAQMTPLDLIGVEPVVEPAEEPDPMAPAVENVVRRFVNAAVRRAEPVKAKGDFSAWAHDHAQKSKAQIKLALTDLAPSMMIAYRKEPDVDAMTDLLALQMETYLNEWLNGAEHDPAPEIADGLRAMM